MVSEDRRSTGERGQLILIGAITLALLVIGIALVVNTVLFTENFQTETTTRTLEESSSIDAELQDGVRSTTLRVNHRARNESGSSIETWVERNVTRYGELMSEAQVDANRLTVTVDYDDTESERGVRIVQTANGSYEGPTGVSDWEPVTSGAHAVGWVVLNINASSSADAGTFFLNASNPSAETLSVSINKTGSTTVNVTTTTSVGPATTATCDTQGGRLLLNVHTGRSFTDDDCVFTGTRAVGNVSQIHIENGDVLAGKYAIVANDSSAVPTTVGDCASTPPTQPCEVPVVWTANVTTTITGDGFTYANDHDVAVYQPDA